MTITKDELLELGLDMIINKMIEAIDFLTKWQS